MRKISILIFIFLSSCNPKLECKNEVRYSVLNMGDSGDVAEYQGLLNGEKIIYPSFGRGDYVENPVILEDVAFGSVDSKGNSIDGVKIGPFFSASLPKENKGFLRKVKFKANYCKWIY